MEQRQQDPEGYAAAYNQCPRCEKRFRTKWKTNKHMGYCRRENAKYVKIKQSFKKKKLAVKDWRAAS